MSEERITKLEINFASMNEKVIFIDQTVKRIEKKIDDFVNGAYQKFAKKQAEDDIKELKEKVENIKDEREGRSYEWLKYAITTIISVSVAVILSKLL